MSQKQITIHRTEYLRAREGVGPITLNLMAGYLRLRVQSGSDPRRFASHLLTKSEAKFLGEQLIKFSERLPAIFDHTAQIWVGVGVAQQVLLLYRQPNFLGRDEIHIRPVEEE